MQAAALGNNTYQKFNFCNFAPSMNSSGKLAAVSRYINYMKRLINYTLSKEDNQLYFSSDI